MSQREISHMISHSSCLMLRLPTGLLCKAQCCPSAMLSPSPCPTAHHAASGVLQSWQTFEMPSGTVMCVSCPGWSLRNGDPAYSPALSHIATWVPKQLCICPHTPLYTPYPLPLLTAGPLSLESELSPGAGLSTLPFLLYTQPQPQGLLIKASSSSQFSIPLK